MSASRGERIRQARQLRRMSQQELAEATGIGHRTVRRVETGENASPRSLTILETYLELTPLSDDSGKNEDPLTDRLDQATIERALDEASFLDLLAAVARKHARLAKLDTEQPDLPPGRYVFRTEDAPSTRRPRPNPSGKDQPDERGGQVL